MKILVEVTTEGPVDPDYVRESIEFAINHYREAEGLSRDSDEGYVTEVTVTLV